MTRTRRVVTVLLLAAWGCAVNPATGRRQLTLVSEGREIALGRSNDTAVVASMGLYPDSALQAYLGEMGHRLAARSERPDLPWTFRLVDDPVVNAFALPGGFIYITRGILAHLNAEAQLAAVLGHEIGHVTGRHSVEQMSRAQLAQVGLGVGMIFSPEIRQVGDLAGAGLGVLFLKFGRDDESEADRLGLRYVLRGGYDPRPMADVFTMLARASAGEGGRVPTWLSTHPDPLNRREDILRLIADTTLPAGLTVGAQRFLDRLDGVVYGVNPRDGFFEDGRFLHPDLALEITFPAGWKSANQRQAVQAVSPNQDAAIQLTPAAESTLEAAARSFFDPGVMRGPAPRRVLIRDLPAIMGEFVVRTAQGDVAGLAALIELRGAVYRVVGFGAPQTWHQRRPEVDRAIGSFAALTDSAALATRPLRLAITRLPDPMSFAEFAARYPSEVPREELARLNQAEITTQYPAGVRLKRVVR